MIVTGGLGHLGSALLRELVRRGEAVTVVDNLSTQKHCSLYGLTDRVRFIEADVRTVDASIFTDQVVVHLAAIAEPQTSLLQPAMVAEHNRSATAVIVNARPKHLIFASTAGLYASEPTPYAMAKAEDEDLIISRCMGRYTIFRFGTLFGPSPGMRFHTAVNKFCWQAATGQPITVWDGAMNAIRPYLEVGDAVEAVINHQPGMYDLASEHATVAEVLEIVKGYVPELKVVTTPAPMAQDSYKAESSLPVTGTLAHGIYLTMGHLGQLL